MNNIKNISEETLNDLFKKIPLDELSPNFMDNLLQRIENEFIKEKRRKKLLTIGQVAAGILCIFILPFIAIYLCTVFLPEFSFSLRKVHLNFDVNIVTIGFSILILLIIDTLFRMYVSKHSKNNI